MNHTKKTRKSCQGFKKGGEKTIQLTADAEFFFDLGPEGTIGHGLAHVEVETNGRAGIIQLTVVNHTPANNNNLLIELKNFHSFSIFSFLLKCFTNFTRCVI